MITQRDYLKPIETMSAEEKLAYLGEVKQWTEETYPELEATVDAWTAMHIHKFDVGVRLASALRDAQQVLATIYQHTIHRRLARIHEVLDKINAQYGSVDYMRAAEQEGVQPVRERTIYEGDGEADTSRLSRMKDVARKHAEAAERAGIIPEVSARRPSNFAEYRHLLPEKLQAKGDNIKEVYIDMEEAREMLERIVDNPNVPANTKAHWATLATRYENDILAFWAEVDAAYDAAVKAQGKPAEEKPAEPEAATEAPAEDDTPKKKATAKKAATKKTTKKSEDA